MDKRFDDILGDAIREAEAQGASIGGAAERRPEQSAELQVHLEVLSSLEKTPLESPSEPGMARGLARLRSAIRSGERSRGGYELMNKGILGLAAIGVSAIVAVLAIGITFGTGNLSVDVGGDNAQASHIPGGAGLCLDQTLGGFAPPSDHFDVDDVLALREAAQNQDPALDRDNDGDVDIDDLMVYITDLRTCITGSVPTPPPLP